jgi:amidophosphoribosyltransferase
MSDMIKHECGIAMIRLLKPLSYYQEKYGSSFYGVNKMYLLMEKQHNRGQDGAGLANIKLDVPPGQRYISRYRSNAQQPIQDIFEKVNNRISEGLRDNRDMQNDPEWLKANLPFVGEVYLGHLRYGTYGGNSIEACHPFLRQNNWMTRNLVLAGNFNMTNVDYLFDHLVDLGQHPKEKADTVTILERIGHFLDEENEALYTQFKLQGLKKKEISGQIAHKLNVARILKRSAKKWDGGYAMAGMFGHGDAFVLRDPNGIRPAFYIQNDEIVAVASERPVLQTAFDVSIDEVKEVTPGHALIIKKNGKIKEQKIRQPEEKTSCSFERIYFSRGNDNDIYQERLQLGKNMVPQVLEAINHDIENTVFSFIPNTAEVAFYGLVKGVEDHLDQWRKDQILSKGADLSSEELDHLMSIRPRAEKVAWKDVKMRTFIAEDSGRDDLVSHVYDTTYGTVKSTDNLVVLDDSIVRGTTLKQSILRILGRLRPKKIVVVSSAPHIRYPDCYGIDMAKLGSFIAFRAAEDLHKERGTYDALFHEVYELAKADLESNNRNVINHVKRIFDPFSDKELSDRIAQLLKPADLDIEVEIIYQSVEGLHSACPNHLGDWYFTGNYPTPGGMRVVNKAFVYHMEGNPNRAY